jgi:hypothetical protein
MSSTIAKKAPITLIVDGKPVPVPRARRKFWREWASELDAGKVEKVTAGMGDEEAARWQAFYRILPTTNDDLVQLIGTPDGSDRIIGHCLREAGIPADHVEELLEDLGQHKRTELAMVLASIVDPVNVAAPTDKPAESPEGGAGDPLASSASAA